MPTYAANLTDILRREPLPAAGITGTEVDYQVGDVACRGYLARPNQAPNEGRSGGPDGAGLDGGGPDGAGLDGGGPDGGGQRPGVLVVHDWLGVTDYVRMRADMLARLGYVAFAGDIYGAATRPTPAEAPRVAGGYYGDQKLMRARVLGAYQRLLAEPDVDPKRTAAIGYCFGGSCVLQLARTGAEVSAVVSFHGALQTGPAGEAAGIRAKLLVLTGAADPVVPDDAVLAWQNELRAAPEVDWQLTSYAGAMHAFTVPDANAPDHGAVFDARAEARSWQAMKQFLAEALH